ncbi:MAG TPA: hypothetical protein DDY98_04875 [Ruminococcaceae bacterium]|nr:hypothetical protein [Oscillospiraceae bacterium]
MKQRNIRKAFQRLTACLTAIALLCGLAGCGAKPSAKVEIASDAAAVLPNHVDAQLHCIETKGMEEIASSGLISLLFDKLTASFAVKTKDGRALWASLPHATDAADTTANVIGVNVIHNGKKYALNSQDHAVAFGTVYCEKSDDGIAVTYFLSDSAESLKDVKNGQAKASSDGSMRLKLTANYELTDGCLFASLKWENLGNKDDVVTDIGFLQYFGATPNAKDGDFLLVPDGSGALIETAVDEELEPIDIAVYGNDYGQKNDLNSVVAAFGQRRGLQAFAAVVQNGDALCRIHAAKAGENEPFHRVGASFMITPCEESEGKLLYVPDAAYHGEISLCYRFLRDNNATYAGIAAVCREMLIRDYTLSTRTVKEQEDVPVMIQVIGSVERDNFFSFRKKLTDFSGAKDVLTRVKSKGINNAFLRCTGFLSGGTDAENAEKAKPLLALGGMKGLKELNEYANGQNFRIFTDINLSTSSKTDDAVRTPSGVKATVQTPNSLADGGFAVKNRADYVLNPNRIKKSVSKTLNRFRSLGATGYCVADVGASVYGDFAQNNRQVVADSVSDLLSPLAVKSQVMVVGGNFYSLKNADVVSGLPMVCDHDETECYTSVPFVPILLHGIVDFCFDEINLQADSKMALLHCIEYGAIPGYVLTDKSLEDSEKYSKLYLVDERLSEIGEAYKIVSELFADLRDARITNHTEVQNGVYCTEYESTTKIYVNYTNESVSIGGVKVEAMSYFRVN